MAYGYGSGFTTGYLTPEQEKMQRQIAALRQQTQSAGVTPDMVSDEQFKQQIARRSGLASPEDYAAMAQSTKGIQRKYEPRLSMARSMLETQMPQGRTVGPSQTYVVNPYEQAAAAVNKLTGAYLTKALGNQMNAELDPIEKAKQGAASRVAYGEALSGAIGQAEERGLKREGMQQDVAMLERKISADAAAAAASRDHDIAIEGIRANAAQELAGAKSELDADNIRLRATLDESAAQRDWQRKVDDNWETLTFFDGATPLTVAWNDKTGEYRRGNSEGEVIPASVASRFIPYEAPAEAGSKGQATEFAMQKWRDGQVRSGAEAMAKIDETGALLGQIINGNGIAEFAGPFNAKRFAAQFNLLPNSWEATSTDQQLKAATISGLAAYSDIFRPMSEKEVQIAQESLASMKDQPEAIVVFMNRFGREQLSKSYRDARASAQDDETKKAYDNAYDRAIKNLDEQVARGAIKYGMSARQMRDYGIPIDVVKRILEEETR